MSGRTRPSIRDDTASKRKSSPGRPRGGTRQRSPARTKSPGRSATRARSPGRPPRRIELTPPKQSSTPRPVSPKRRSPIRASPRRSPPRRSKLESSEIFLRPTRKSKQSDSESDSVETEDHGKHFTRSIKDSKELENNKINILRRVTRSSSRSDIERIIHLKGVDTFEKRIGEFSDEDEIKNRKEIEFTNLKQIKEFGGWFGALFFILITPISIFGLLIVCNEQQCSFRKYPSLKQYTFSSTYFHPLAYIGFICYAVLLALFSIIPFGGKKVQGLPTKSGRFLYIMNGFFSFILLISIGIGLEMNGIKISAFITQHLFQLLTVSTLYGLVLTIYAYVRSFYVPLSALNIHAIHQNPIYGFFMGREVSPRMFGLLDLKMYVYRIGIIGPLLIDLAFLHQSLTNNVQSDDWIVFLKSLNYNPNLILLVAMHLIYFLNGLLLEDTWITSFEIQYEGFGYMSGVGYFIYPFMTASVTKYIIDYNINLPSWALIFTGFLFLCGFIFFAGSNKQKDTFRKNPYDPSVAHLETIPTSKGKKLLCSGFWGVVRHPNYLGDILMNLTFTPFCWNVPPVVTVVSIVLLLLHRSVRDNTRCKDKYGPSWDRYCSKVKYVLLPKIY